jgi:hypothetical protein
VVHLSSLSGNCPVPYAEASFTMRYLYFIVTRCCLEIVN